MKIAIIGAKGIPCKSGGVEKYTEELAVRLVQKGHRVFVYVRFGYNKTHQRTYKGVRIIYTPYLPTKNLAAITHTFISLIHVLFKEVDIIHIQSAGPSLLAFIPRILKRKTKTIVTFHSRDRFNQKWGLLGRFFLSLGEWTATHFPHTTITVSQTLYNFCHKRYPKSNLIYIPNGASLLPLSKPRFIKKWNLSLYNYFLVVARLLPLKGIHYLIQAFQRLNLNKKLVIVGEASGENESYKTYLQYLAKEDPHIIFTGEQRGRILQELFSNAYLFVLPSEVEGLSISLLEALSFGRCALVSNIPENKEAIGEMGYTFKSKNVSDLSLMLKFLNDHPELVFKAGRLSRERIYKYYNWDKIIERIVKLYQALGEEKKVGLVKMQGVKCKISA